MKRLKKRFPARVLLTTLFAVIFALSVMAGTFYAVTVNGTPLFPSSGKGNVAAIGAAVDAAESGDGDYTITVNTAFESGVASQTQKIEYFADGNTDTAADYETLGANGTKVFTAHASDTTPTLNLKNSANARISGVVIKNAVDSDITASAFGGQIYYDNFIESCKTSLFGYIELQNITGNITVNVTYDTPVTFDMLGYNTYNDNYSHATTSGNDASDPKFYSVTVVAKGDVGPYSDNTYEKVVIGPGRSTYNPVTGTMDTYAFKETSASASGLHYTNGFQTTHYCYCNPQDLDIKPSSNSYIESVKLYDNDTGDLIQKVFDAAGKGASNEHVVYTFPNNNRRNITYVITYRDNDYTRSDTEDRPFSWSIDTSSDSYFKPVTKLTGKLDSITDNIQTVTTSDYNGNLYYDTTGDEKVTVTLGGDTSGGSAFYNTNLVYTLKNPSDNSVYAKFRVYHDEIIPVECTQETLDNYVSGLTVSSVDDTFGVCETLSFDLTVPASGMSVTSTPMYTFIPVEIRHRVVDENGNYLRDGDSSLNTNVTEFQYSSDNSTDYTNNKYFYVSDTDDYYENLTSASPTYTAESFSALGASTKAWMAKGYYFHGFYLSPQTAEGYNFKDITYAVSSRTGEIVSNANDASDDRRKKVSGFGIQSDGSRYRLEYGDSSGWDSDFVAADKIVVYVNYTQNDSYVPVVTPGSTYSITVNSHFEGVDNDDAHSQYIEIYDDTTKNPIARTKNHVAAAMPVGNTTPTLNLKSNSKVSVKSVVVKDENGNDITSQAFGYDQYNTDFIESCKTSLFGYLELQNIKGNITVDVTYGEPIADKSMGNYNSNLPYFSVTVITKGDVGPYGKAYQNDYEYQDVYFGSGSATFNVSDEKPSGSGSGRVYNPSGHYTMRDGSQITRYDYYSNTAYFDYSYYSYISDIKMYYNDTGEEVKTLNLAGEAYTTSRYNSYSGGSAARSITYVVTYKAFDSTTIYANLKTLQYKDVSRKIRLDADEGGRFADYNNGGISSANTYTNNMDENTNPFTNPTYSGGYWGKVKAINTDSVKFYFDNEQGNSIDFRHFKVYSLDVNGNTFGEQIAGEGCDNPLLTLTYSPERTGYESDGWVTISGLRNYDGDIYVTADTYRYNHHVSIRQSGEHTDSFTITADDAFGAISGAGQGGDAEEMRSSCTKTADKGSTEHWMYSGGQYTVKTSGDQQIQKVTLHYYQFTEGSTSHPQKTVTYDTKNTDGSISFTFPTDSYFSQTTSDCYLTVYYEPITTYEAQIYPVSSGGVINSYYSNSANGNSNNLVELSVFDGNTEACRIFNTASDVTTAYQTLDYNCFTSNNTSSIYKIPAGTTVKVKNIFTVEQRAVSTYRPQGLIDFANRAMEFKDIKIYEASDFKHNSNGDATVGVEISVTRDGDYYVFTMPESGVRIVPEYECHQRSVNILSSERDANGKNYSITKGTLGTASLTGENDDDWFISNAWYYLNGSYLDNYPSYNYAKTSWTTGCNITTDGSSYVLTAAPTDSANYTVKSVKAYKYNYANGTARYNKMYNTNYNAASYNWLTYDSEGNITNEEITGVVGALGDPDANGARSCTITLPDTLDVGNIVLWVEFAPKETTTFAHFKYEPDTTSEKPFNPIVNLKGVFTGDYTSLSATDGKDVEAAVFDEDNAQYLNLELGGTNQFRSGFYQYNLIYTIKDYTSDTTLAKFRVYRDQIYPIDCTEEELNEYLVTSACTFEEVSGTDGVCEKATLRFKLPENGLTLSYQSERLYIPVTVKQYVKDSNGDYQPANNDLTATLTKYFENTSGLSDFAQNKYFAKDSTLTSSYGLNTAESSAFADTVTVTGAEETHYMLIENLKSWQGFYIMPSTARGYTVSSDGIEQKSYNRLGGANTWDGYMSSDTKTYLEGSGYCVRYHAEYRSDMSLNSSDINSHMGAQRVEISVYYEQTNDYYADFTYAVANSSGYKPNVTLRGTIQYDADGVVSVTDGYTVSTAVYDETSTDPKTLTVEIGGGNDNYAQIAGSIYHQANLIYTLRNNGSENADELRFRIYNGKIKLIGDYTPAQIGKYLVSTSVEGYKTDTYSGLREIATLQLKVPEEGLTLTYTDETPYLPVTVRQYVLDSEGNATEAGEGFTADVTKYADSSEFGKNKYFASDNTLTDSYGLNTLNQSNFVNNYTVTGASDTRYMVWMNSYSNGLYVKPNVPEGYTIAAVQGKAYNPAGDEITTAAHKQSWTDVRNDSYDTTKGYLFNYSSNSYSYLRGASLEVNVYYQPATTLTVKQTYVGTLGNSLPSITITNANTSAPLTPYSAYINDNRFVSSISLTNSSSNVNEQDPDYPSERYRTTEFGMNAGTKPQVKVNLAGARNVASIKLYQKTATGNIEVPDTDYTVSGTGEVNGNITLTMNNAVAIGDNYLVDIVYGNQRTLTVKPVMRDSSNNELSGNDYSFADTKATITVNGKLVAADGTELSDMPFIPTDGEGINSFTVTQDAVTYNAYTNTRITLDTMIDSTSDYVIANVKALDDRGNDLNLVTPTTVYDDQGLPLGTTYEHCTLPSLTSGDNVTIVVYFAKVAELKVKVVTVGDDGTTLTHGVPHGAGENSVDITNSYVTVKVVERSTNLNQNGIITAKDEGYYYTGNFDVTYDPNERTVKVLQGTTLDIFAQVPNDGRGTYVVSKVVTNGSGYQSATVGDISHFTDTDSTQNLRFTVNTGSERINADKNYDLTIYVEKAKSIYTRAVNKGGDTETSTNGTVTVKGVPEDNAVLPFTVVRPTNRSAGKSYDAVYTSSSYDYTSEAKCVRNTALSFEVTPQSNYEITKFTVKSGLTKETAISVGFTASAADEDTGKVTYTLTEPMNYNYNLYVDVVFEVTQRGKITFDVQYTDDFVNYKYLYDETEGLSTLSLNTYSVYVPGVSQIITDAETNEEFRSKSDITFSGTHSYYVTAGVELRSSSTAYSNGKLYISAEGYLYDNNADKIIDRFTCTGTGGPSMSHYLKANDDLTFHVRLVPMGSIGGIEVNNNCYKDTPDGVKKTAEGSVTVGAHFVDDGYDVVPLAAMYVYPSCSWTDRFSFGYNGDIVAHSQLDTVTIDYEYMVKPGAVRNVTIYEIPKEDAPNYNRVTNTYSDFDFTKAAHSWDITSAGVMDEKEKYINYNITGREIITQGDMVYRVVVTYDLIEVKSSGASGYNTAYLAFGEIDGVNVDNSMNGVTKLSSRFDASVATKNGKAYFVIVSKLPKDEYYLTYAYFYDYKTQQEIDLKQNLLDSYTTRTTSGGITRYYYYYEINPDDRYPIDNSMQFRYDFDLKTEHPNVPVEENLDCEITVEQWNRDTYDGQYVAADNQSVEFSAPDGSVLMYRETGVSANPLTVTAAKEYLFSNRKTDLTIKPIPFTGYNVEKIVITDSGTGTYSLGSDGTLKHKLYSNNVTIKIYYSRPLLRISATNEGKTSKAQVDVYNSTTQELSTVLYANTFTNGVFVTKNDDAQVIIRPITYEYEGASYYYTVASIRIGDTYDNTSTAYTEANGAAEGYSVTKAEDDSEFVLTINDIKKDKYIFIQLVGRENIRTSSLLVNQQIRLPDSDSYVDCMDGYYGTVTVHGTLTGVDNPLNFDEEDCASYTLSNRASAEGTAQYQTQFSLDVTPPSADDYVVKEVTAVVNGSSARVTQTDGRYYVDLTAPNSGSTVITVKYALRTVPYTLHYKYQSYKAANEDGGYGDDNLESDEKTYTVNAELYPSELTDDGKPTAKALAAYAPAISDLYKDCTWTIDDDHVEYDVVNHTATVTADQKVKTYTVEFKYADQTQKIERCPLNSLVQPDGKFIEAPEKDGDNDFACWIVTDKDEPIKNEQGEITGYKEVARCFSREFNLRVTGNYIVTAYYEAAANALYINEPEFSRQQYTDANGNLVDRLYADFILAFMEKNGLLLNEKYGQNIDGDGNNISDIYRTGLILEYDSAIMLEKADETGAILSDEEKAAANALYNANDVLNSDDAKALVQGSFTSTGTTRRYVNYTIKNTSYNNKNRLDKSISFGNSYAARHLVMRAYYYVYNTQTEKIEMTAPVYFYLYDIGNSEAKS